MLTAAVIVDSVPVAAARSWLAGLLTVPDLTTAGTNCGSCRGDIAAIIKKHGLSEVA